MATAIAPEERVAADPYAELVAFFDRFAEEEPRWKRRNSTYHRLVRQLMRFHVPPGRASSRSAAGRATCSPRSSRPTASASTSARRWSSARAAASRASLRGGRRRGARPRRDVRLHRPLRPRCRTSTTCSTLFERVAAHSHERTRVVINSYSRAWRPIVRLAEVLRLKPRKPIRNWVSPQDVRNLLELAGFETVTSRLADPAPEAGPAALDVPERLARRTSGRSASSASPTGSSPGRCRSRAARAVGVSVVCPCRNEAGNIAQLIERIPDFGAPTELIFVEGDSTDGTRGEILRQIEPHPEREISLRRAAGQAARATPCASASTRPSTTC